MSEFRLFETTIDELDQLCGNDIDACDLEIDSDTLYGRDGVQTITTTESASNCRLRLCEGEATATASEAIEVVFETVISFSDIILTTDNCADSRMRLVSLSDDSLFSCNDLNVEVQFHINPVATATFSEESDYFTRMYGVTLDATSTFSEDEWIARAYSISPTTTAWSGLEDDTLPYHIKGWGWIRFTDTQTRGGTFK